MLVIDRTWWGFGGAHGGLLAASALAATRPPGRRARVLTVHYLEAVDDRPLEFETRVEREGRGATVASFTGVQGGRAALVGSAVFGPEQPGPEYVGTPMPRVPPPHECDRFVPPQELAAFAQHLEIRPATRDLPLAGGPKAELVAWMRFLDRRPVDAEAVVVLVDALPPALYAIWTAPLPVPSAELTVHFGSDEPVDGWVLVRIRTDHAAAGWAVEDAAVWAEKGRLLGLARQSRRVLRGA
ncbi:hypothetical protein Lesp02_68990 [Lentzea sp. NBRC 105346]|uniref:acyl-CoA thioesterase n=1 Tax=Lentzea sp. NBRC 105346 TaxID=3032205 RepID=UPI00249FC025|nr:thioesterase family protein [Lentzea sp. NBRC 105346]GLZ34712.1 hypothetical protein Lesp02_68990 [Lentzea sp. NBRC 105346]